MASYPWHRQHGHVCQCWVPRSFKNMASNANQRHGPAARSGPKRKQVRAPRLVSAPAVEPKSARWRNISPRGKRPPRLRIHVSLAGR